MVLLIAAALGVLPLASTPFAAAPLGAVTVAVGPCGATVLLADDEVPVLVWAAAEGSPGRSARRPTGLGAAGVAGEGAAGEGV